MSFRSPGAQQYGTPQHGCSIKCEQCYVISWRRKLRTRMCVVPCQVHTRTSASRTLKATLLTTRWSACWDALTLVWRWRRRCWRHGDQSVETLWRRTLHMRRQEHRRPRRAQHQPLHWRSIAHSSPFHGSRVLHKCKKSFYVIHFGHVFTFFHVF